MSQGLSITNQRSIQRHCSDSRLTEFREGLHQTVVDIGQDLSFDGSRLGQVDGTALAGVDKHALRGQLEVTIRGLQLLILHAICIGVAIFKVGIQSSHLVLHVLNKLAEVFQAGSSQFGVLSAYSRKNSISVFESRLLLFIVQRIISSHDLTRYHILGTTSARGSNLLFHLGTSTQQGDRSLQRVQLIGAQVQLALGSMSEDLLIGSQVALVRMQRCHSNGVLHILLTLWRGQRFLSHGLNWSTLLGDHGLSCTQGAADSGVVFNAAGNSQVILQQAQSRTVFGHRVESSWVRSSQLLHRLHQHPQHCCVVQHILIIVGQVDLNGRLKNRICSCL